MSDVYELDSLEVVDATWIEHDTTAIAVELQRSDCVFQGERINGLFRVLSVWRNDTAGWRLAALQYTAVAEAARVRSAAGDRS